MPSKSSAATHRRLNITLPVQTLRLLDRLAPKGDRSRYIDQAVRERAARAAKANLRRELKEGAIRNAERDRRLTAEWDGLSAEVWAQLDRDEEL